MKKTLYRAFALLLTASFLFTMASPAFATSVTEDTFLAHAMPADIVTSSLINGIGVLPGDDVQVYEGVVQRCVDYLTDLGRVVDGKIDVWKREQVGENAWKYGADISLVEVIRSWLFDTDTVSTTFGSMSASCTFSADNGWSGSIDCSSTTPFELVCIWRSGYSRYNAYGIFAYTPVSNGSLIVTSNGKQIGGAQYGDYYFAQLDGISGDSCKRMPVASCYIYHDTDGATSWNGPITRFISSGSVSQGTVEPSSGLTTGFIAPGSVVFGDAYPDWYRNIATIPLPGATTPDDDIKALPFAPGQTLGDTLTIPQEDVWTGSGSYVDAPSVPDTATLSDVLTAVLSIPANIVEGIGNLFFPAVDGLTMSLSDFFPFCIPYDLFEFFTLLRSEPEAPKFEWEIPVPQLGRTFEVEVDLSAWDEVAQLFRNLELLAFIVGLAFVTREKFLRS